MCAGGHLLIRCFKQLFASVIRKAFHAAKERVDTFLVT
jgi:hypothetical protein